MVNKILNLFTYLDIDRSLNETVSDKIRKCRSDCNNNPPHTISFMSDIPSTRSLGGYLVNLYTFYIYKFIEKLTVFVQFQEFRLRCVCVCVCVCVVCVCVYGFVYY
jgi:hypothetical protein